MFVKAPYTPLRKNSNKVMPSVEALYHDRELRKRWSNFMINRQNTPVSELQQYFANLKQRREVAKANQRQYGTEHLYEKIKQWGLTPKNFKYEKAIGIEIECFSSQEIPKEELPFWVRATNDGSIRADSGNEIEFRILAPREKMESRLYTFCQTLNKYEFKVNRTCGLHVHFDFRGREAEDVKKEARKLTKWLKTLKELVPSSRRTNNYCRLNISSTDRYRAVNICSFSEHGSLEVRFHSGTTDFTKIVNWIRLIEAIFQKKHKPKNEDCIQALMELPLTRDEIHYWINRHKQLNPKLYIQETAKLENE